MKETNEQRDARLAPTYAQRAAMARLMADREQNSPTERNAWLSVAAAWEHFAKPAKAPTAEGQRLQALYQVAQKVAAIPAAPVITPPATVPEVTRVIPGTDWDTAKPIRPRVEQSQTIEF